jgi:asparagine synthase (glutamine-hydrolysing)
MCGIAGWVDFGGNLKFGRDVLESMTRTLSKRGPDDAGHVLFPHAALGHRRLIVVDPEGGGQPMLRKLGKRTYCITYNGELYNTPEVRRILEGLGYHFLSRSDTEVVLYSFIEWKEACVERLNGIFAFAIWDEEGQSLFLARDRLGVKPLFYGLRKTTLIFGSELKAVLAHPLIKPELDAEGLAEIFAMGPGRTPGCGVFKGINELKPGHCMIFDRKGIHIKCYWSLESRPHNDSEEVTAEKIRYLLEDAVRRQLVSDVPLCTLLSGGIDSSAITAMVAGAFKSRGETVNTFSVDYTGNDVHFKASEFQPNSDPYYVKKVSSYFNTNHRCVTISNRRLAAALDDAVLARDLPGMADIDSSLYLFCLEVKKGATVALAGEGADEIFGGYPWFRRPEDFNSDRFPWARKMHVRTGILSRELLRLINPEEYLKMRYRETLKEVPRLAGESPFDTRIREITYLSITRFMPTLIDRMDRMSMATGLEVRVPYLDHRLVQYVWNIPWRIRSCGGIEKGILRRAVRDLLPEEVLNRKKSPYPKTHNPEYLALVRSCLLEILHDPSSPLLPFVDRNSVIHMLQAAENDINVPWFGQLMTGPQLFAYLIQVNFWLRKYGVTVAGTLAPALAG